MFILILLIGLFSVSGANDCISRDFGDGSIVCVCNSTYCDFTPEATPKSGTFLWYVSSKSGQRMNLTIGNITKNKKASTILTLNPEIQYQKIKGFGGAFTDSTGINLNKLSKSTQQKILETYFSKTGSRYNFGRIPIGGTDFSTRLYTYDDVPNDLLLKKFSLAPEDLKYKIPLIQKALKINPELWFFAAAWTAPPWMKTNNYYTGYGFLKKELYQVYADYLLKFLDEYKNNGIQMWAISTGNEPINVYFQLIFEINAMGWSSKDVGTWIAENLGPSLAKSQHNETMILALDDQKYFLPWFVNWIFENEVASKFVSGIAYHYYADFLTPPALTDLTHESHPDKFLLMTEACEGAYPWEYPKVRLGFWTRAENYVLKMFENLNHWSTGWVDWNLVLDKDGGPTWNKNFVDAPVIVNPETDEFFKQPLYYVIHHFSRFVSRGSVRVDLHSNAGFFSSLASIAFQTPKNETVILIYNWSGSSQKVDIIDPRSGNLNLKLPAKSLSTIVYRT